jgi:hypothetical protein
MHDASLAPWTHCRARQVCSTPRDVQRTQTSNASIARLEAVFLVSIVKGAQVIEFQSLFLDLWRSEREHA